MSLQVIAQDLNEIPFNLPLVVIDTDGNSIPNDPKITAHMGIINNPSGINYYEDSFNDYDGFIGIELRGNGSLNYHKASYGVETRDEFGENNNVSLLGFPEENDWILYATHVDKSLMRNVISYDFIRKMGWYASRARHVELILNGEYRGVYVLLEKIKRDDNRVDIRKNKEERPPDSIGYIVKVDAGWNESNGWESEILYNENGVDYWPRYQYVYPEIEDISEEEDEFIRNYMLEIDEAFWHKRGKDLRPLFDEKIDLSSLVDLWIMNEFTFNPDGYRLSTFFNFNPGSDDNNKLIAGPYWDYNFGYSNYFERFGLYVGWDYDNHWWEPFHSIPFWWTRMSENEIFIDALVRRWRELRETILQPEKFNIQIDSITEHLGPAIDRNAEKWTDDIVTGDLFWATTNTYDEDVTKLKDWIVKRLDWMDQQMSYFETVLLSPKQMQILIAPNPISDNAKMTFNYYKREILEGEIVNIQGIPQHRFSFEALYTSTNIIDFSLPVWRLENGVYYMRILRGNTVIATEPFCIIR